MTNDPKTLTRMDLAEAVYHDVGLSRKASGEMVDVVLEEVMKVLERGESVKISGFGNFSVRSKRARVGRNPKTGVEVTITPRKVLVFKSSPILKERVNDGK
ncbi:MAG: integration host factor subunit alpha [Alphaproteobacteria bacterium CG_4_10_14_0_8_um_filter_53_9]|nr:MAG: integration host factor subunit alpha [Alphaproteobacteria bacterium CG_4_10_14_0_8_um_filter_53_9]